MALRQEFIGRFHDFKAVDGMPDSSKIMFESKPSSSIWFHCNQKDSKIKNKFKEKCLLFASTYVGEKTFSIMKINKGENISLLTHSNIHSMLGISSSNLTPNFDKLVSDNTQMHHFHRHRFVSYGVTLFHANASGEVSTLKY